MATKTRSRPFAFNPLQTIQMVTENREAVPDIIEFNLSDRYLDRPNLYPRQGTLLKIIFLQDELFTQYDYDVIGEWEEAYLKTADDKGEGNNGIVPGVLDRIAINKAAGRKWFRETLAVIGRRGSKGHIGAIAGAYVLWNYLCKGDPQRFYGIDRDKRLTSIVFAGKKEQAKANQWRDLNNVIVGAPCFAQYISRAQTESLTIFSPRDLYDEQVRRMRGVTTEADPATFEIVPRESTVMAGRGPASFMQHYDEVAHVVKGVAKSPAEDVYEAATPALDQFGLDGFLYLPSSPWQKIGLFYDHYLMTIETEVDEHGVTVPVYPEMLMIQLASWDIYKDWEIAHQIPRAPDELPYHRLSNAVQEYDHQMRQLERANPETFKVERRCLDPDTRVLCADLSWRRVADLEVGDEVIAVDEHAPGQGAKRKMGTATVEATATSFDTAYRLTFEDDTSVVCSGTHRWLSSTPGSPAHFRWRSLFPQEGAPGPRAVLSVGDRVRWIVDPWEPDTSWEAGYLAGVYDGEGTVVCRERSEFRIDFTQNPGEVLDATQEYLWAKGFDARIVPSERRAQRVKFTGLGECLRFVGQVGGHKMRRQAIPHLWDGRGLGQTGSKVITAIERLPAQELIDIQTSMGTFVAEGLVSHNSHFATVMDAYLKTERVAEIWEPWPTPDRPMAPAARGNLATMYRAHGDPSKSGANFGFAIGHMEGPDERGLPHVVFDVLHHWDPTTFEEGEIDYDEIGEELKDYLDRFMPNEMTFDQFNSVATIQQLQRHAQKKQYPKRVQIYERPATGPLNWKTYETFKTAIGLGLVHAPYYEMADLELTFLQDLGGKVEHPTSGPVQTKDVADCMAIVVYELIGEQMAAFIGKMFSDVTLHAGAQGGMDPYSNQQEEAHQSLSAFGRGRTPGGSRRRRR